MILPQFKYHEPENSDGPIRKARVVMGSVAPVPLRARSAEKVLIGQRCSKCR
jgi:CO/xanthine dehydrogenase FAD-binding subunit